MATNKVEYFGETLMDISDSTVTPDTLAEGYTAYNAAGQQITGQAVFGSGGMTQEEADQRYQLKNSVTPQDYGAVGDGVTDDTNAFQQMLDSGKDCVIPMDHGQKYLITKTLTVTTNGQDISGTMSGHHQYSGDYKSQIRSHITFMPVERYTAQHGFYTNTYQNTVGGKLNSQNNGYDSNSNPYFNAPQLPDTDYTCFYIDANSVSISNLAFLNIGFHDNNVDTPFLFDASGIYDLSILTDEEARRTGTSPSSNSFNYKTSATASNYTSGTYAAVMAQNIFYKHNTAIKFTHEGTDKSNTDSQVFGCTFVNFETAISFLGRGFLCEDNFFWLNNIDVDLILPNQESLATNDGNAPQFLNPVTGRGFRFSNNRSHICYRYFVRVTGTTQMDDGGDTSSYLGYKTTKRPCLYGAMITNNVADWGQGSFLFTVDVDGLVFSNNVYFRGSMFRYFLDFIGKNGSTTEVRNSVFSGNAFQSITAYDVLSSSTMYGIFTFNKVSNTTISGNTVKRTKTAFVDQHPVSTGSTQCATNLIVTGNNISEAFWGSTGSTALPYQYQHSIVALTGAINCSVHNNVLYANGTTWTNASGDTVSNYYLGHSGWNSSYYNPWQNVIFSDNITNVGLLNVSQPVDETLSILLQAVQVKQINGSASAAASADTTLATTVTVDPNDVVSLSGFSLYNASFSNFYPVGTPSMSRSGNNVTFSITCRNKLSSAQTLYCCFYYLVVPKSIDIAEVTSY